MIRKTISIASMLVGIASLLIPAPAVFAAPTSDDCQHAIRTQDVPTDMNGDASVSFESDCLAIPNRAYVKAYTPYISPGKIYDLQMYLVSPDGHRFPMGTKVQHDYIYAFTDDLDKIDWLMGEWRVGVVDRVLHEDGPAWDHINDSLIIVDLDY